jgi:hypothetical protein
MYCHVYLRNGIVYLPTMGKMGEGFYRGVEPVAVVPAANIEELRQTLLALAARGNPSVPMLRRSEHPPAVLLKYARVKTWSAFDRSASLWSISEKDGSYEIHGYKTHPSGRGSVRDPNQKTTFPQGSTVGQVIDRMIRILQDATRGIQKI